MKFIWWILNTKFKVSNTNLKYNNTSINLYMYSTTLFAFAYKTICFFKPSCAGADNLLFYDTEHIGLATVETKQRPFKLTIVVGYFTKGNTKGHFHPHFAPCFLWGQRQDSSQDLFSSPSQNNVNRRKCDWAVVQSASLVTRDSDYQSI